MRRSCILVVVCLMEKLCAESGTDVQDVLTKLFTTDKYNKKIRPLVDQSGAVQISVDFFLTSIIDFNDQDESLKTSGFLSMEWTDEYLQWNPANYNGVDVIFLPQDDIWRPGVSLRNPYKSFTGLGSAFLNLRVDSSGGVEWYPFQVFESTCDVDITYFPFDTQSCELKFIAWSYSKEEVELNKGSRGLRLATRIVEEFPINKFYKTIYKVSMFLQCRKQKNKVKPLKLPDKKAKDKLKKEDEFDSERKKCKLTWMKVSPEEDYKHVGDKIT
ncbi:neuronal acetylcholine receptor subunit beta-4-like [Ruditapes philippinarum]|uniref:neuronal acetylcholine receptor subunit beta-4-like n=1 Tax=Ruditapes philippinarum TaxID=129788 RepID=UPI00295B9A52|nr:neuronal acetylcholine receptor subunit beta-4-like [Ruditapes philippinarum]